MGKKEKIPRSIAVFSSLYPFAVLTLSPEIANALFFSGVVVSGLIHGRFGRTLEHYVGLGLLYSILVYVIIFFVGLATLALVLWMTVKAVVVTRGLFARSEKSRKAAIAGSLGCAVFLLCTLWFFNFGHPAEETGPRHGGSIHAATLTRTKTAGHRGTNALDLAVLSYLGLFVFHLSRGTTKSLFRKVRREGGKTPGDVSAAGYRDKPALLWRALTLTGHRTWQDAGRRLSIAGGDLKNYLKNRSRSWKTWLKTTFSFRKGKKPAVEEVIAFMGWTNLLLLALAFATKQALVLGFMSAGWAAAIRLCVSLFSGGAWPLAAARNGTHIFILGLGTAYGLYHLVLISLFLATLKKREGAVVGTYTWGLLSMAILITFTKIGFDFHWT